MIVVFKKDPCLRKEIVYRVYNSSSQIIVNERMLAVDRRRESDLLFGISLYVKFYFKNFELL